MILPFGIGVIRSCTLQFLDSQSVQALLVKNPPKRIGVLWSVRGQFFGLLSIFQSLGGLTAGFDYQISEIVQRLGIVGVRSYYHPKLFLGCFEIALRTREIAQPQVGSCIAGVNREDRLKPTLRLVQLAIRNVLFG